MADIINNILQSLVDHVNSVTGTIPDLCPFAGPIESIRESIGSEYLGYINYFLPVSEIMIISSVWVVAIVFYYAVSLVLRWVKAIS